MGIGLLLFLELFCPAPEIYAWSLKWTIQDQLTKERAVSHCYTHHYSTGNPCLKKFLKIERQGGTINYRAICGPEE